MMHTMTIEYQRRTMGAQTIAREARCSPRTARRWLHGQPIRPGSEERIIEAVRELESRGYVRPEQQGEHER